MTSSYVPNSNVERDYTIHKPEYFPQNDLGSSIFLENLGSKTHDDDIYQSNNEYLDNPLFVPELMFLDNDETPEQKVYNNKDSFSDKTILKIPQLLMENGFSNTGHDYPNLLSIPENHGYLGNADVIDESNFINNPDFLSESNFMSKTRVRFHK